MTSQPDYVDPVMKTRQRFYAEFWYPGLLFSDSKIRDIDAGTIEAALAAAPDDDRWYAVSVHAVTEKRYVADDGDETWVRTSTERVLRAIIGEKVHVDLIPDDDEHSILRSNIRYNSTDGYGVRARTGNWQIAQDYDLVLASA